MPLVSVIIPCFNAQPWLRATLESVAGQHIQDLETIVIDDGSTDKSAEIIEREFPHVTLIKDTNKGPSHARNVGTHASKGEFIQYLDADDMLAEGKLTTQLEKLKTSGCDIAYGDWQRIVETKNMAIQTKTTVSPLLKNPEIDLFNGTVWCPPAVYLFRRSIVEKAGPWREDYSIIQDARFMFECALKGASFINCKGIMAYYRVHSSQSVSRKDPQTFNRECLKEVTEAEQWWKEHNTLDENHRKVLVTAYGYVARTSFENDKILFKAAYQALQRLEPGYAPRSPLVLNLLTRICGYQNAESLALLYRRIKKIFFPSMIKKTPSV